MTVGAHNLKVTGSNPVPATIARKRPVRLDRPFSLRCAGGSVGPKPCVMLGGPFFRCQGAAWRISDSVVAARSRRATAVVGRDPNPSDVTPKSIQICALRYQALLSRKCLISGAFRSDCRFSVRRLPGRAIVFAAGVRARL